MNNTWAQTSRNLLKIVIFLKFLVISPVWELIDTWGFHVDVPCDFPDIPISPHKKFTKPNTTQPLNSFAARYLSLLLPPRARLSVIFVHFVSIVTSLTDAKTAQVVTIVWTLSALSFCTS